MNKRKPIQPRRSLPSYEALNARIKQLEAEIDVLKEREKRPLFVSPDCDITSSSSTITSSIQGRQRLSKYMCRKLKKRALEEKNERLLQQSHPIVIFIDDE